jgi:hypothetical protein
MVPLCNGKINFSRDLLQGQWEGKYKVSNSGRFNNFQQLQFNGLRVKIR